MFCRVVQRHCVCLFMLCWDISWCVLGLVQFGCLNGGVEFSLGHANTFFWSGARPVLNKRVPIGIYCFLEIDEHDFLKFTGSFVFTTRVIIGIWVFWLFICGTSSNSNFLYFSYSCFGPQGSHVYFCALVLFLEIHHHDLSECKQNLLGPPGFPYVFLYPDSVWKFTNMICKTNLRRNTGPSCHWDYPHRIVPYPRWGGISFSEAFCLPKL